MIAFLDYPEVYEGDIKVARERVEIIIRLI